MEDVVSTSSQKHREYNNRSGSEQLLFQAWDLQESSKQRFQLVFYETLFASINENVIIQLTVTS